MKKNNEQLYNLSFIGAGLSCTYTLIHFIEQLEKKPLDKKVEICVIDKTSELWTGIPYGNRSGINSLIITSLKEFLPPSERILFTNWLADNVEKISKNYTEAGGSLSLKWLKNNEELIRNKLWDKLYIPRHVFGQFLKIRMTNLLESAVVKGLINYELVKAEVINIHKHNSFYQLILEISGEQSIINSEKVILSIGSPPKKEIEIIPGNSQNYLCIQDMYELGVNENFNKINSFLEKNKAAKKNVLIIGSNASSLEVLYNLENYTQINALINKFYVLSPDAMFPHRINENKNLINFTPVHLTALKNSDSNTCENILEAVKKDVDKANKEKIDIADIYEPVSHVVIELLNSLDVNEQLQFVYKYGVEIGKFQRRAGAEYRNVADRLIAEKKMEFIKGKFVKQIFKKEGCFQFEYIDASENEKKCFDECITIIINCIGSENLSSSYSPLIQNLIKEKIAEVNGSQKGFSVNENFESNDKFFVMGPLLSGTLNKKLRIWHAESCPRIFFLAQQLAEYLIQVTIRIN